MSAALAFLVTGVLAVLLTLFGFWLADHFRRRRIVRAFLARRAARTPEEVQADIEETMERCMPGFMAAWRRREAVVVTAKEGDQGR